MQHLVIIAWEGVHNCEMDNQQPQRPAASNGEAMWECGAEKGTPSVNVTVARAGVRRRNTTDPVRRSMRRGGNSLAPGYLTAPAAFNVAGGRNSIDLPPSNAGGEEQLV